MSMTSGPINQLEVDPMAAIQTIDVGLENATDGVTAPPEGSLEARLRARISNPVVASPRAGPAEGETVAVERGLHRAAVFASDDELLLRTTIGEPLSHEEQRQVVEELLEARAVLRRLGAITDEIRTAASATRAAVDAAAELADAADAVAAGSVSRRM
jgi:hypothetical protein